MRTRVAGLALLVVIGIGVAVLGSLTAPSSPGPVPAGYTRVGGAAQGISIAAPSSWVAVNLAKETIQSAASKAGLSSVSAATLVQDMESLQKLRAVAVFDTRSLIPDTTWVPRTASWTTVTVRVSSPLRANEYPVPPIAL